uniref:Zn(2)-C6 fungal-type domain-containing protein n=1 Tax=Kwoniella dejecticola CBS 10117 TaxID=1296121 RepID=A0A1A6A4M7_9TREE|nr:uncharacterized protein I303_04334 [Kwoniella dejecticola CBS 10117]OBR85007.1 hypothetical protein I303_04334 [Kwoniella dejecticola CBS 10117]
MNNSPYRTIVPPDRRSSGNNPTLPPLNSFNPNVGGTGFPDRTADAGRTGDGTPGSIDNNEHRNFPQTTQAALPQQYQHFSSFSSSTSPLQPLMMPMSSRTLPPAQFQSYNNPHLRSSPHGYPETMQQMSSPITPHRYDFLPQPHSYNPSSSASDLPPWQYSNPENYNVGSSSSTSGSTKRRESLPEMANKDEANPLFSNRPMVGTSTGSEQMISGMGNGHGNGNDSRITSENETKNQNLQSYIHSLTGLVQTSPVQATPASTSSNPLTNFRAWQPISQPQPPPLQPPPSASTSTPVPTQIRKRSRASTFGSRTTDDEVQTNPAHRQSIDDGDELSSRPTTADRASKNGKGKSRQPSVTARDFSKQPAKGEPSDEAEIDHVDDGDEKIDHRKRKRNRTIRSCVPCHNHKRRCDRKRPCGRCTALGLTGTCVYEIDEQRDMNDPDVIESERLRRRIAELEQVVRELRQKTPARAPAQPSTSSNSATATTAVNSAEDSAGEDKKRRVIVDRFARFKIDEAKDVENSAAAAGSALKENPAGQYNQHGRYVHQSDYKSEPYQTYLLPGEEISSDITGRKVYLGASTGKSMLRRLRELAKDKGDGQLLSVPEDIAFTGVFPDLRKTYPFTTIWSHENFSAEIIGLLPNSEQAELLWRAWEEEHAVYVNPFHTPSMHTEYSAFFAMSTKDKMNVPLASLALYLIICALGCVIRATTTELFGQPDPSRVKDLQPRKPLPTDYKDLTSSRLQSELYLSASSQALRLCAFLANPTMKTVQAQLLQMVYLLASERAADAWTTGGTLVKQAIALGLHKDPLSLDPRISMRDAEIRRRVWWSIAGFDCMLCVFFDRPDANLSDIPGSAQQLLPPSNVLVNETTEQTFHAAYYQLTIPSFELLDRIFTVDRRISRSSIYGWFSPPTKDNGKARFTSHEDDEKDTGHTYQDAVRLANDISQWYSLLPAGIRFSENDTPEYLTSSRSRKQLNQTLILSIKTWTIVMVLHRPYLRLDPTAYPESTEICTQAAHLMLRTYKSMADTKSTIAWSFWTMSYRAFQAGAVCAFLAIRQPGTPLAEKCLSDLRGGIRIFEDRLSTWNATHPVQADLCEGLVQLEKLVTAATHQRGTPTHRSASAHSTLSTLSSMSPNLFGVTPHTSTMYDPNSSLPTPLSQIQAFPPVPVPSPANVSGSNVLFPNANNGFAHNPHTLLHDGDQRPEQMGMAPSNMLVNNYPTDFLVGQLSGDFNGPEPLALPQFWANMFGIRLQNEKDPNSNVMSYDPNSNPTSTSTKTE